ncbi:MULTISPECIES: PH domain-containing protein [unclassified Blastococcus]
MTPPARFRMNRSALLPVILLALGILPTALVSPWTLLLLLVPVAVAAWVLRTGVDVDDRGITARSLVGSRTVPWPELAGIRLGRRGELWLVTTRSTEVRLPVLRVRDLPRLAAASGGRLDDPSARPVGQ